MCVGRCFKSFHFSSSYSDVIANKLNWFPQVESFSPMAVTGEWPLSALTLTHEPLVIFFSPLSSWGGLLIELCWAPGVQPRETHHNKNENYFKLVFIVSIKRTNTKTKTDQQKLTVEKTKWLQVWEESFRPYPASLPFESIPPKLSQATTQLHLQF